jgi:hypothetical protein
MMNRDYRKIGAVCSSWPPRRRSAGPGWCGRRCARVRTGGGPDSGSWIYGFAATLQPDAHFGRILAAYGGVFVAGSLAWGMIFDGFRPDRWDITGSVICLLGVAVIMFAPRNVG